MATTESIGQRFTQLIQHLGLSKNAFAQSLDKTATVIQHLVEERNKPGYDLLCKVFEIYPNVSKDWLMEGAGPMLKMDKASAEPAISAASPAPAVPPTVTAPLFSASEPAPRTAVAEVQQAPSPAATAQPAAAAPAATQPAAPVLNPSLAPAPAPVATPAPVPDPAYFAVALQTQYLQHQLALAEQRNQHLLEQQALMQQLVAVLQRAGN